MQLISLFVVHSVALRLCKALEQNNGTYRFFFRDDLFGTRPISWEQTGGKDAC